MNMKTFGWYLSGLVIQCLTMTFLTAFGAYPNNLSWIVGWLVIWTICFSLADAYFEYGEEHKKD